MDSKAKTKPRPDQEHPTILDSPKKRRSRIIIQIIICIVILIVGVGLIISGLIPILIAKNTKEIMDDYDSESNKFKSYTNGDKIVITGKITEKVEASKLNNVTATEYPGTGSRIRYELDDKLGFYSNEDFGEKGEIIYVECEVKTNSLASNRHYLKETYFYYPFIFILAGIIILIFGLIITYISYKKLKTTTSEKSHQAHHVATMYKSMESVDDEDMMYLTLREKAKKP